MCGAISKLWRFAKCVACPTVRGVSWSEILKSEIRKNLEKMSNYDKITRKNRVSLES